MYFAYSFFGFIILINIVVTVALIRDSGLSGFQKFTQSAFVWVVPILGAILVLSFLATTHSRHEMRSLVPFPFYLLAADIGLHSGSGYESDMSMTDGMSDGGGDGD